MAKPLPLPVWDRQQGKLVQEWMDDHQPHYESDPQRSFTQWIKSQPLYDQLYAVYENSRWSTHGLATTCRFPLFETHQGFRRVTALDHRRLAVPNPREAEARLANRQHRVLQRSNDQGSWHRSAGLMLAPDEGAMSRVPALAAAPVRVRAAIRSSSSFFCSASVSTVEARGGGKSCTAGKLVCLVGRSGTPSRSPLAAVGR